MRRATTLTLAALLAMILVAGAVQLFFVADRTEDLELRIEDATGREGSLRFVVRLSSAARGEVRAVYATSDANAVAGVDYTDTRGEVVFQRGDTVSVIEVPILASEARTAAVRFVVELTSPRGAVIDDGRAIGTIEP